MASAAPNATVTPRSLQGADADGEVGWNSDGTVRLDRGLRRRFDFLLAALGEVTLGQVRARLEGDVASVAPPERAARVMEVFNRYVSYLERVSHLGGTTDVERLVELHALRVQALGPEMARAFFEDEEETDARTLDRRAVLERSDLGESARAAALAAVEERRPRPEREALERGALVQETLTQTAALEASGATPEQKQEARAARFGTTTAGRLADLDAERARWSARVDAFRRARDTVMADEALDDDSRRRSLGAILEHDFSAPEQRRIRALELGPKAGSQPDD